MERQPCKCDVTVLRAVDQALDFVGMPGVMAVDRDERIIFCNAEAGRIMGFNNQEVVGRLLAEVCPLPSPCDVMRQALRNGVLLRGVRKELPLPTGLRHINLTTDVVTDDQTGEPIAAMALFSDINELVALENQLRDAQRLADVGQMAAGAVHELRNPLTTVRGFVQLFARAFAALDRTDELRLCDTVLAELDRAGRLLTELLVISRPGVGNTVLDLGKVIRDTVSLLTNRSDAPRTELDLAPLSPVCINPERVRQVIANLWQNAAEAVGCNGLINVVARDDGQRITVAIEDNGPGLAPLALQHLFEPFVTTKEGGTGLGLVICRRIIVDCGGALTVTNRPGGGVSASFVLPVA